jgi:three-Cys-motif partner protein
MGGSDGPFGSSDGLAVAEVGAWAETKYALLAMYASMFATATKNRWRNRVYIDLFSGPGKALIRGTFRVVEASPLLALGVVDRFTHYVFCERDPDSLDALKKRVLAGWSDAAARFVAGDTNANVDIILSGMPTHSPGAGVISLCFADPWKLKNLKFTTVEALSARRVDFLVLIPTDMDANRNWKQYLRTADETVDEFLGTKTWRNRWEERRPKSQSFGAFLAEEFCARMRGLGYEFGAIDHNVHVRSGGNLPLYRLGFFSRHPLGEKLWRSALKYGVPQQDLFRE